MVGSIASRKAGKALLSIVSILMLPLIVLGAIYVRQVKKDIRVLGHEIAGVEIAKLAHEALLDHANSLTPAEMDRLSVLERSISIPDDFRFTAFTADNGKDDRNRSTALQNAGTTSGRTAIASYLSYVGDASGLILDSESMSFHLANAYVVQLPQVLEHFEAAAKALMDEPTVAGGMNVNAFDAQRRIGGLMTRVNSFSDAIGTSERFAVPGADYSGQKQALAKLQDSVGKLSAIADSFGAGKFVASAVDRQGLSQGLGNVRAEAETLGRLGLNLLGDRLAARKRQLEKEVALLFAAAVCCAVVALALAGLMFRRTLVKLDQLEDMNKATEFARAETERINGEIAELNRELSDNLQKLSAAQSRIVQKGRMEQLGQLTATVAHELRNPLGAVRTSAFLIQRKVQGKGIDIESQLDRINTGVTRCDNIIAQLLDFSRTRKITPHLNDLDEWLAKLVGEEAIKFPPALIVECSLGLGGVLVPFDSSRLERAVMNMMTNAVEAMLGSPQDPAPVQTANPLLQISTMRVANTAIIRVKDNGPGIAAENLQRIREPLFTTKNFGTGLGIPAIEQIATQHSGQLVIESRIGEGACFELSLPLHQPDSAYSRTA